MSLLGELNVTLHSRQCKRLKGEATLHLALKLVAKCNTGLKTIQLRAEMDD